MTEQAWLGCTDVRPMLRVLCRDLKVTKNDRGQRKLRLLCCALARSVWATLEDQRSQAAVETSERFADGLATSAELRSVCQSAQAVEWPLPNLFRMIQLAQEGLTAEHLAARAESFQANARRSGAVVAWKTAAPRHTQVTVSQVLDGVRFIQAGDLDLNDHPLVRQANEAVWNRQASVLREVFGNPFRPYPASLAWPSAVVRLAEAVYKGEDCSYALHDALVEAGHADLAAHFCRGEWHPKGCWALDLILEKGNRP